ADETGEYAQLGIETAEDGEEEKGFDYKITEQKRVQFLVLGNTVAVIAIKDTESHHEKPAEAEHSQNSERNNNRERSVMIIANDLGSSSPAEGTLFDSGGSLLRSGKAQAFSDNQVFWNFGDDLSPHMQAPFGAGFGIAPGNRIDVNRQEAEGPLHGQRQAVRK